MDVLKLIMVEFFFMDRAQVIKKVKKRILNIIPCFKKNSIIKFNFSAYFHIKYFEIEYSKQIKKTINTLLEEELKLI